MLNFHVRPYFVAFPQMKIFFKMYCTSWDVRLVKGKMLIVAYSFSLKLRKSKSVTVLIYVHVELHMQSSIFIIRQLSCCIFILSPFL